MKKQHKTRGNWITLKELDDILGPKIVRTETDGDFTRLFLENGMKITINNKKYV